MNPLVAYRLFRFYRKCGSPLARAIKKAVINTLKP
jgi:hypothetical protein